jgi:hypothetical protein
MPIDEKALPFLNRLAWNNVFYVSNKTAATSDLYD